MWGSDPTIFAWELCNECHTSDNYEIKKGLVAGSLLYNWQAGWRPPSYFALLEWGAREAALCIGTVIKRELEREGLQ